MLSVGGFWQEHWSRVSKTKVCLNNPMLHLDHLVLRLHHLMLLPHDLVMLNLVIILCYPKVAYVRGVVGRDALWLLTKKNLGAKNKDSCAEFGEGHVDDGDDDDGTHQACAEVGQGHDGQGGEEEGSSRDLCHEQ